MAHFFECPYSYEWGIFLGNLINHWFHYRKRSLSYRNLNNNSLQEKVIIKTKIKRTYY